MLVSYHPQCPTDRASSEPRRALSFLHALSTALVVWLSPSHDLRERLLAATEEGVLSSFPVVGGDYVQAYREGLRVH